MGVGGRKVGPGPNVYGAVRGDTYPSKVATVIYGDPSDFDGQQVCRDFLNAQSEQRTKQVRVIQAAQRSEHKPSSKISESSQPEPDIRTEEQRLTDLVAHNEAERIRSVKRVSNLIEWMPLSRGAKKYLLHLIKIGSDPNAVLRKAQGAVEP